MANPNLDYEHHVSSKIFAYIDRGYKLSDELKNEYRNSLIFIGDEGQIYSPVNDTYVGIGHTAYTNTIAYIENAYAYVIEQVGAALMDIINNSLNHNVTQFNGLEKQITLLSTQKDSNEIRINNDERKTDYLQNYNAIKTTTEEGGSLKMTNGLAVTSYSVWIRNNATLNNDPNKMDIYFTYLTEAFSYTSEHGNKAAENWMIDPVTGQGQALEEPFAITIVENGRDTSGKPFPDKDVQDLYTWLGSYVYVDDKKTVDYVKKSLAYSITFTKYWNDKQNNSLYGAILGIDKIPLYYENLDGVDENDGYINYQYYTEQEAIDKNLELITENNKTAAAVQGGTNLLTAVPEDLTLIYTEEFVKFVNTQNTLDSITVTPKLADLVDYILGTTYRNAGNNAPISNEDAKDFNNEVNYLLAKVVSGSAVRQGDLKVATPVTRSFYVYKRNTLNTSQTIENERDTFDKGGWREIVFENGSSETNDEGSKYIALMKDIQYYTDGDTIPEGKSEGDIKSYNTLRISNGDGTPKVVKIGDVYTAEEISNAVEGHPAYGKTAEDIYWDIDAFSIDKDGKIIIYLDNENANDSIRTDIVDGIQTIKEVAYILDTITDGDEQDGGISIAYSIAKNKIELNRLHDFAQSMVDGRGIWKDKDGAQHEIHNVNTFSYTNTKYITTIIDGDYTKNIEDKIVKVEHKENAEYDVIAGNIYYTSLDGRGAFVATENRLLEQDEELYTNAGDDYYNKKNISFLEIPEGMTLTAGKVYYTDGQGGGRFTATGEEVCGEDNYTYFEKVYSGDIKFTPILQIATPDFDTLYAGEVLVLNTQAQVDEYNAQLDGAVSTTDTNPDTNELYTEEQVLEHNRALANAGHIGDVITSDEFLGLNRNAVSGTNSSLDHAAENVVVTYLRHDAGLVDTNLLNSYVSQSYNLLVKTIQEAEVNSQLYTHETVDLLNYNSLYTKLTQGTASPTATEWEDAAVQLNLYPELDGASKETMLMQLGNGGNIENTNTNTYFFYLGADGEYHAWENYKYNIGNEDVHPGGGLWIKTIKILNESDEGIQLTPSHYIKQVTQKNGYVTALYGTFQVSDRHYVVLSEDNYSQFNGSNFIKGEQFGYYGTFENPLTSKEAVWIHNASLSGAFNVTNGEPAEINNNFSQELTSELAVAVDTALGTEYVEGDFITLKDAILYNATLADALDDSLHTFVSDNNDEITAGKVYLHNTRYTGQFTGNQGDQYNYAKLIVEGDVINLSTYSYAVESVTSYGFLADALSVKSYIMNVLEWIDITPNGMDNILLNAAYRRFDGATTTTTVMGVEQIPDYYEIPVGTVIGVDGFAEPAENGEIIYTSAIMSNSEQIKAANTYVYKQSGIIKNGEWVGSGEYIEIPDANRIVIPNYDSEYGVAENTGYDRYYYISGFRFVNTFFNDGAGNQKYAYVVTGNDINAPEISQPNIPEGELADSSNYMSVPPAANTRH